MVDDNYDHFAVIVIYEHLQLGSWYTFSAQLVVVVVVQLLLP